uniref:Uncharacterized protein n=1 Tax=Chromera velia CCMP2878 TaxID=1169474 RepID=A0A0G4HQB3_9ALVE|eukprot:Cvel_7892.t1-p1 / transcript=Cvel_7892.t1 / gene=Cvel_7892 / organism=Chromera_velia_CCMP2878 / gene_product=hypothetical protein / transcript_product=hypothetical protein / location=Cvel_scaffold423:40591-40989(-) / protein_length=100 / sequence_SO=supercontig / SO=protein_coding / is_pseudo=false
MDGYAYGGYDYNPPSTGNLDQYGRVGTRDSVAAYSYYDGGPRQSIYTGVIPDTARLNYYEGDMAYQQQQQYARYGAAYNAQALASPTARAPTKKKSCMCS